MALKGTLKDWLSRDGFPYTLEAIANRKNTPELPLGIKVKNTLGCEIYNGTKVYTITSSAYYEKVVLYIHGGAFIFDVDPLHISFCDKLASETNAKVYLPLYKLAPQATYRDAYKMLLELYRDLLMEGKEITIMGDSAGGGLSLSFVQYLNDKSIPAPQKMVLLSAWLDATMSNEILDEFEQKDKMLSSYGLVESGKLWADGLDLRDYKISPIFGSFESMPDTLLFTGTSEIMYPDTKLAYDKMKDTGANVDLICGEGMSHIYELCPLPEGRKAQEMVFKFVK